MKGLGVDPMTRMALLRNAGVGGLAAVTLGAILPESAEAMESRVYARLVLDAEGRVHAGGPIYRWDFDAVSAVIVVTVAQGAHVVSGESQRVYPSASRWQAVTSADTGLSYGKAWVQASMAVLQRDGTTDWYPWDVTASLVA